MKNMGIRCWVLTMGEGLAATRTDTAIRIKVWWISIFSGGSETEDSTKIQKL